MTVGIDGFGIIFQAQIHVLIGSHSLKRTILLLEMVEMLRAYQRFYLNVIQHLEAFRALPVPVRVFEFHSLRDVDINEHAGKVVVVFAIITCFVAAVNLLAFIYHVLTN